MHHAILFCPVDNTRLTARPNGTLVCEAGHDYPVIDGVPVLLRDDVENTIHVARASIARARNAEASVDARNPDLHLESLGITENEKRLALQLAAGGSAMDPIVSVLIAATNGIAYKHLIGREFQYPIPELRLPPMEGKLLLDIGCNWGRWSVAAARKGYRVIGIDPSLGALMAARRVARQLDLAIDYVCTDGRHLPFDSESFDTVFSYSVIQHFSRADAKRTLKEISRVLKPNGRSLVQMPNYLGVRSLLHQWQRRFAEGSGFDVRYWSIYELQQTFEHLIGRSEVSVHCYFGLGLEPTDLHLMRRPVRAAVNVSGWLRKLSAKMPWLTYLADSVYVSSVK